MNSFIVGVEISSGCATPDWRLPGRTLPEVLHGQFSAPTLAQVLQKNVFPLRGIGKLFGLAGEVEDHGRVFVGFAPGPGFGDVIGVFKLKDEMVLVAGRR